MIFDQYEDRRRYDAPPEWPMDDESEPLAPHEQGHEARVSCQGRDANPHPLASDAHAEWLRGWEEAEELSNTDFPE